MRLKPHLIKEETSLLQRSALKLSSKFTYKKKLSGQSWLLCVWRITRRADNRTRTVLSLSLIQPDLHHVYSGILKKFNVALLRNEINIVLHETSLYNIMFRDLLIFWVQSPDPGQSYKIDHIICMSMGQQYQNPVLSAYFIFL